MAFTVVQKAENEKLAVYTLQCLKSKLEISNATYFKHQLYSKHLFSYFGVLIHLVKIKASKIPIYFQYRYSVFKDQYRN